LIAAVAPYEVPLLVGGGIHNAEKDPQQTPPKPAPM